MITMPEFGWEVRVFVMTTPIDDRTVELRAGLTMRVRKGAWAWTAPLRSPPGVRLARRVVFDAISRELAQDIAIWSTKYYLGRPAIAAGDGPIAEYRLWAGRFHPAEHQPEASPPGS
jgi:hypothetical protein